MRKISESNNYILGKEKIENNNDEGKNNNNRYIN